MQAVPPAAPQSPAAAQLLQSSLPPIAGADRAQAALPQFDAAMTKALLAVVQTDQTAPVVQQPVATLLAAASAMPATPATELPMAAQPPPSVPTAATDTAMPTITAAVVPASTVTAAVVATEAAPTTVAVPAVIPAVIELIATAIADKPTGTAPATQKADPTDRQRTTRYARRDAATDVTPSSAEPQLPAEPSATAMLAIMAVPADAPPAVPVVALPVAQTATPAAAPPATSIEVDSKPDEKRTTQVQPPPVLAKPVEQQAAPPDGPTPPIHDVGGLVPAPPPVHAAAPTAPELPASLQPPDAPQPASAPTAPVAPASSPGHTPASPAAQIAPVLVSMAHAPDGAQRLTLRLDPPELGHVQIRIDRPLEAPARVEITVERPETLTLLLRDQPQLQRALDQAGVPSDGRSVTIHVAATESAARPDGGPAPSQGMGSAGTGDATYGAPRQGGNPAQHETGNPDAAEVELAQVVPPGWVRGGLDITA
jgi:hypothetical protein